MDEFRDKLKALMPERKVLIKEEVELSDGKKGYRITIDTDQIEFYCTLEADPSVLAEIANLDTTGITTIRF